MPVRGSLRTMSVVDVFDWIERSALIGHLSVERGDAAHSFHLDKGAITAASSNLPGERLGLLLMSRGLVNESQLSEAFALQAETGVFLGKVLLEGRLLSETALKEVLEIKLREAVWDVLSWEEGHFHFEEGGRQGSEFEVRVPLRTTLDLGVLQVKRWRQIRERIPVDHLCFWLADAGAAQDLGAWCSSSEEHRTASDGSVISSGCEANRSRELALNLLDTNSLEASIRVKKEGVDLLECVKRGLSVNQMVLENCGRRFLVLSRLYELLERGAISVERRSEARDNAGRVAHGVDIEVAARARAAGGNKADALAMTTEALGREPENESLQVLHKELQRSLFAELSRELLGTFRVPRLIVDSEELSAMDLDDHERYLAGRIDGHWDLLSLMRISPIREVDALIAFKRLQIRGIIEL